MSKKIGSYGDRSWQVDADSVGDSCEKSFLDNLGVWPESKITSDDGGVWVGLQGVLLALDSTDDWVLFPEVIVLGWSDTDQLCFMAFCKIGNRFYQI